MTEQEIDAILAEPKSRLARFIDGPVTTGLIIVASMYFAVHITVWIFTK